MITNRYTPKVISESTDVFSIPLYQRLFEWNKEQIIKLLDDLRECFVNAPNSQYYIGLLTAVEHNNKIELIDGQQRMTVMVLLAIYLKKYQGWNSFYLFNNNLRLQFFARDEDMLYLQHKYQNNGKEGDYVNQRMEDGFNTIASYFEKRFPCDKDKADFSNFIFTQLTFFISYLPKEYNSVDLNRYFESMNSAGKGLENYEILGVDLLKKCTHKDKDEFARIWKIVSNMDKPLIKRNSEDNLYDYNVIKDCTIDKYCDFIFNINNTHDSMSGVLIKDIPARSDITLKSDYDDEQRVSIISFPEFLLLVLNIQLQQVSDSNHKLIYRTDKLIESFSVLSGEDIDMFFYNLLYFRLLFDIFVIKINKDGGKNDYSLIFNTNQSSSVPYEKLVHYQSMLYVSSEYRTSQFLKWLIPYLELLKDMVNHEIDLSQISLDDILHKLKNIDNQNHSDFDSILSAPISFRNNINNYIFRRLDYYLWEQAIDGTTGIFNSESAKVASKYTFRFHNSIEHLHPQNQSNNEDWDEETIHRFGNLALISQGFNSEQSNDSVEVKFARIDEEIRKGNIESLKMYCMYLLANKGDHALWNKEKVLLHENQMLEILKKSLS